MKRIIFITILSAICALTAVAQDKSVVTHQTTGGRDRIDIIITTIDIPHLEYDRNCEEIIVSCGDGAIYNVTITSQANQQVVLETSISGPFDTFSTAMATTGTYIITLTGIDNTYMWTFDPTHGVEIYTLPGQSGLTPNRPTSFSDILNHLQSK